MTGQQETVPQFRLEDIRMRDPFILEPAPGEFVLFGTSDDERVGRAGNGF